MTVSKYFQNPREKTPSINKNNRESTEKKAYAILNDLKKEVAYRRNEERLKTRQHWQKRERRERKKDRGTWYKIERENRVRPAG